LAGLLGGCNTTISQPSPVAAGGPPAGGTVTGFAAGTAVRQKNGAMTVMTADLQLSMDNLSVTGASVTLVTPTGSYPMPFIADLILVAHYAYTGGFTYTPGQPYHFEVYNTPRGNFTTPTAIAPGGITIDPSGSPLTWAVEGNADVVNIFNVNATAFTYQTPAFGNENSPFNATPFYPASGGVTYQVAVGCAHSVSSTVGATSLSTILNDNDGDLEIVR
jgi:hypothetical protein